MGMTVQSRLLTLTARASDLELQQVILTSRHQEIALKAQQLMADYSNYFAVRAQEAEDGEGYTIDDHAFIAEYEYQLNLLNNQEKRIETEQAQNDTQLKAVSQEIEAVEKVIDKIIKRGFGTFGD